jgi:hypothetical protein
MDIPVLIVVGFNEKKSVTTASAMQSLHRLTAEHFSDDFLIVEGVISDWSRRIWDKSMAAQPNEKS